MGSTHISSFWDQNLMQKMYLSLLEIDLGSKSYGSFQECQLLIFPFPCSPLPSGDEMTVLLLRQLQDWVRLNISNEPWEKRKKTAWWLPALQQLKEQCLQKGACSVTFLTCDWRCNTDLLWSDNALVTPYSF